MENFSWKKCAVVTLVMLREDYVKGAIALAMSLKLCSTRCPNVICLVTSDIGIEARKVLSEFFTHVIEVASLYRECPPMRTRRSRVIYGSWIERSFTKWQCLSLFGTTYDRLIFIDSDSCVTRNIDHLFTMPASFATQTALTKNMNLKYVDEVYAHFDSCWSRRENSLIEKRASVTSNNLTSLSSSLSSCPSSSSLVASSSLISLPQSSFREFSKHVGVIRPNILGDDRREYYRSWGNRKLETGKTGHFVGISSPSSSSSLSSSSSSLCAPTLCSIDKLGNGDSCIDFTGQRKRWNCNIGSRKSSLDSDRQTRTNLSTTDTLASELFIFKNVDIKKLCNVFNRNYENESYYGNFLMSSAFVVFRRFYNCKLEDEEIISTTKNNNSRGIEIKENRQLYDILLTRLRDKLNTIFRSKARFHNGWDEILFVQSLLQCDNCKIFHLPVEYCWVSGFYEKLDSTGSNGNNCPPFVVTYYGDRKPWTFNDNDSTWLDVYIWRWFHEKACAMLRERFSILPLAALKASELTCYVEITKYSGELLRNREFESLVTLERRKDYHAILCRRYCENTPTSDGNNDLKVGEVIATWKEVRYYDLCGWPMIEEFFRLLRHRCVSTNVQIDEIENIKDNAVSIKSPIVLAKSDGVSSVSLDRAPMSSTTSIWHQSDKQKISATKSSLTASSLFLSPLSASSSSSSSVSSSSLFSSSSSSTVPIATSLLSNDVVVYKNDILFESDRSCVVIVEGILRQLCDIGTLV